MARAGLGEGWECLFANDFDKVKAQTYRANWGGDHFHEGDVHALTAAHLPQPPGGRSVDLAWASSPCQDLSLAGKREGLSGARSSAFWGFWSLMKALNAEGRAPRTIVIENVTGLLTSHGGADFTALCQALADEELSGSAPWRSTRRASCPSRGPGCSWWRRGAVRASPRTCRLPEPFMAARSPPPSPGCPMPFSACGFVMDGARPHRKRIPTSPVGARTRRRGALAYATSVPRECLPC